MSDAQTPIFDQIFYFGDSLTDGGGIFDLSSQAIDVANAAGFDTTGLQPIPISPPYAGVFSNGPVYAQLVPDLLGIDDAFVSNFAFGGAEALGVDTLLDSTGAGLPPELTDISTLPPDLVALLTQNTNLPGQLDLFDQEIAATGAPLANSAASIFIGLNDFQAFDPTFTLTAPFEIVGLAAQVVDATLDAARHLAESGVGTIILNTLPDASFFPIINQIDPAIASLGDFAVGAVNLGLRFGAAALELSGINVEIVDLQTLTDEISADATTFGFLELAEPALLVPSFDVVPNPVLEGANLEQVAFFDPIHATAVLHEVFAAFTEASLTSNTIFRGDGSNLIFGRGGDDLVLAGGGSDNLFLFGGDDVAIGGLGNDRIRGQRGEDLLAGGSGDDRLDGGRDGDVLAGGAGDDEIEGGRGNDALADGLGNDFLDGGRGDDLFLFTEASLIGGTAPDSDRFEGGSGVDTLVIALTEESFLFEAANFEDEFVPSESFTFESLGLVIEGIEEVVFTIGLGFDAALAELSSTLDDPLETLLAEADLFGFI